MPAPVRKQVSQDAVSEQGCVSDGEITVRICRGPAAITFSYAREVLGWLEETKTTRFGEDFLFEDCRKRKIRCTNNTKNRPLNVEWALTLAQDILNRKWRFNCETIIVGRNGQILSGQHRFVGLALAVQMWQDAEASSPWRTLWKTEPVLESLVAFGAEESDEYIQTLDNVRARTLADTLYTSDLFKTWKPRDKKTVVKVADAAVRLMWERTGMADSKYASRLTNTEAYEFLDRHQRLLDAVKHVYIEDIKGSIRQSITLGQAAGMLYLQAASGDSRENYDAKSPPGESSLTLRMWADALRFWVQFSVSRKFDRVKALLARTDSFGERVQVEERLGMIVKAWTAFVTGDQLDDGHVSVGCDVDADGVRTQTEFPLLGGIDVCAGGDGASDETEERESRR